MKTMIPRCFILTFCAACSLPVFPASAADLQAEPFSLREVKLLEGPFLEAQRRNAVYLLSLDPERLLHTFRLNAGIASSVEPYGGWESPKTELRGHSLGHYLTACNLMYAATGDERFRDRVRRVVDGLVKCQQESPARGFGNGYLSAFPELLLDRWDRREKVWAPWYTLHKIMAGLLDSHEYAGSREALDAMTRMAQWTLARIDSRTAAQFQSSIENEIGGVGESLANLYALTGKPEHLRAAQAFDHRAVFDPLERGEDRLDGLHANTQVPKIIAAARLYELTGEPRYRRIAGFFWRRVALARSFVHGGHSDREHFFPVADFASHLQADTAETCNTYNMLKLTRRLFAWEPSAELMDFYERAMFNHILASQDPATGQFVYFLTVKPGHFKTYSTPDRSFWCCVGTGMENHARYAESVYYRAKDAMYVNLFVASSVKWEEKGLTLRQETRFPDEGIARLTVSCRQPVDLTLMIRHPGWAERMVLTVNGRTVDAGKPSTYASIRRTWKNGDRVEIRLGMRLRTEPLPGVKDQIAVLYGPVVLAGELGRSGIESLDPHAEQQRKYSDFPVPEVPAFLPGDITARIHPVRGQLLHFRTRGLAQPSDVSLVPLFRLHNQRYSVYWKVSREATTR